MEKIEREILVCGGCGAPSKLEDVGCDFCGAGFNDAATMDSEEQASLEPLVERFAVGEENDPGSVDDSMEIRDMQNGDVGYTTPWALKLFPDGSLGIRKSFPVESKPLGTVRLKIKMQDGVVLATSHADDELELTEIQADLLMPARLVDHGLHRLVKDMRIGEVGYTVPWALNRYQSGALGIEKDYPVFPEPGGTATLKIKRNKDGVAITALALRGSRPAVGRSSDLMPVDKVLWHS